MSGSVSKLDMLLFYKEGNTVILFIVGVFVGANVGLVIFSLLASNRTQASQSCPNQK